MRSVFLAMAFTLILATAGCGSSSKSTVTLQQFAARANAICLMLTQQQGEIAERHREDLPTAQNAVSEREETITVSRAADQRVRDLPRPAAEASTIARLADSYFEEAAAEQAVVRAISHGDRAEVELALSTADNLTRQNAAVARGLGMFDCSKVEGESVRAAGI